MLEEDFLEAIVKGDSQRVVRLLGLINCSATVKDGRNALHVAAEYGNPDIISVVLLSGLYDNNIPDLAGYTALHIAASVGHLEAVKLLIRHGINVGLADNVHGNTALHEAAWKGFSQTVAELVKTKNGGGGGGGGGGAINAKNWGGFTALHLSCQKGHNQSCRELLLAGCDVNVQNNYGDTPLHTSARYGHAGVMRILISAECRVSDQNKNGDTALHIAAAMDRKKLIRILLQSKCDTSITNKQKETAEAIAIRKCLYEVLRILQHPVPVLETVKSTLQSTNKVNKAKKAAHSGSNTEDNKCIVRPQTQTLNMIKVPWSPYGCHYYPDNSEFPQPKLDSLPHEPLKSGEQYYLDLAGNIRKGPVGVGYACYCVPHLQHLENRIEKKTNKLRKQVYKTENAIHKRLNTIEHYLLNEHGDAKCAPNFVCTIRRSNSKLGLRTRSFESVFASNQKDEEEEEEEDEEDDDDDDKLRSHSSHLQKEKKSLHLNCLRNSLKRTVLDSKCAAVADANSSVWMNTSFLDSDSCESSNEEDDGEKTTDMQCNDSGYSTKMCSNSQGPSPSLSGRLEKETASPKTTSSPSPHIRKQNEKLNPYLTSFQKIIATATTIKEASIV